MCCFQRRCFYPAASHGPLFYCMSEESKLELSSSGRKCLCAAHAILYAGLPGTSVSWPPPAMSFPSRGPWLRQPARGWGEGHPRAVWVLSDNVTVLGCSTGAVRHRAHAAGIQSSTDRIEMTPLRPHRYFGINQDCIYPFQSSPLTQKAVVIRDLPSLGQTRDSSRCLSCHLIIWNLTITK
ncbi:hypothetical protein O181_035976 [Austropuccinia psidii MF-1]|uniref:Uncharacterized protein n=1 Tax=Austropuccinia psidii MF-1 TaxID=1389203 RepID=A0A9Q3D3K0_9BASI|nr:hypothetical protein [Austropuccinia psidii MF-1]